jgi:hypothetical protein
MAKRSPQVSAFELLHGAAFGAGLGALAIGAFSTHALWYLVAAPCLVSSGMLVLFGCRLTLHGPLGDALRAVLGASKLTRVHLRALLWIVAGIWIGVLGVERLRVQRDDERPLQEPLVIRAGASSQLVDRALGLAGGR